MNINFDKLNFSFSSKPLLIGGKAMEYYGLRPCGDDIDFIICATDYRRLAGQYPHNCKSISTDVGVCLFEFEAWQSIYSFGYDFLAAGAIEQDDYLIISLEKLLFLKALGMLDKPKYRRDLELIVGKIRSLQPERCCAYVSGYPETVQAVDA